MKDETEAESLLHSAEYRCNIIVLKFTKFGGILINIREIAFPKKQGLFMPLTSTFLMN